MVVTATCSSSSASLISILEDNASTFLVDAVTGVPPIPRFSAKRRDTRTLASGLRTSLRSLRVTVTKLTAAELETRVVAIHGVTPLQTQTLGTVTNETEDMTEAEVRAAVQRWLTSHS